MNDKSEPDWDPMAEDVLRDQRAAYDEMRERCPVAYSEFMQWSLFRHEDVTRVIHDHDTFSNAVSQHLSVPNGMDPPDHTAYRRIIDPYFAPERMDAFEPTCRGIVADQVRNNALARGEVELMADIALPFAVRVQCAFLGWPPTLYEPLVRWAKKNSEATPAQDRQAMSEIAREFEGFIDDMLGIRFQAGAKPDDITTALMHEKVWGRPLSNEEIASILRNWTVGEIGTISAAVGILVHYLAQHAELQKQLRAQPSLLPAAIDEILRIHGPLVANRRITTCPVEIGGRKIDAGERISLTWISANRDGCIFENPDTFSLDHDPAKNLLYGAGIHVCPGAPLARMELRVVIEELFKHTTWIEPVPGKPATNAVYPASGLATLPLRIRGSAMTDRDVEPTKADES